MEHLTINATLLAKEAYERLAATLGVMVKAYHSGNGQYADTGWQESCTAAQQHFSYCGVGQHNQNGIAKSTFVIYLMPRVLVYCMPSTVGLREYVPTCGLLP
jgi:hypothetical protein